jgi:Uma2 family endonuclease
MSVARKMGPYTWDDFIALPDDDRRELIDGELVEVEVPTLKHARVVGRLVFELEAYLEARGGFAIASCYKVRISDRRGVMPDVQAYRKGNEPGEEDEQGLVTGRPDLVVEVISPSSPRYDRVVKLGYYLSRGVPEYWIVDPATQTLEQLVLAKDGGYRIAASHAGDQVFAPRTFPGLRIALARLWSLKPKPSRRVAKKR